MKIFVFEYVTGGGLYREPLPASLVCEGDLMLQSLLRDLSDIPDVVISTTRDHRLTGSATLPAEVVSIPCESDFDACWQGCVQAADAVWLIAPETDGVLESLGNRVMASGKLLLGCSPASVEIAASKSATSEVLTRYGLLSVPIYHPTDVSFGEGPWVAKPDDGAGCEDTHRFENEPSLRAWLHLSGRMDTHIVQPLLSGEAASLSMLCKNGKAWLLTCNRQLIQLNHDDFSYHGSIINGMAQYWQAFEDIAARVAQALPGLAGYVGVDLIVAEAGMTVLEINPRLTTSYVGMHRAIGFNPARLVLDMFYNDAFELPLTMARNVVVISLNE